MKFEFVLLELNESHESLGWFLSVLISNGGTCFQRVSTSPESYDTAAATSALRSLLLLSVGCGQPLTIKKCQDELGMFRVSFVAAMWYTFLQKRRHMFPDMEKPRPTVQEARLEKMITQSWVPTWIRDSVSPPQC
jgi:hypothetical protein